MLLRAASPPSLLEPAFFPNLHRPRQGPFAGYTASKAGVIGLTRQAAHEVACCGIRVNAVAPGITATPMAAALKADVKEAAPAGRGVIVAQGSCLLLCLRV